MHSCVVCVCVCEYMKLKRGKCAQASKRDNVTLVLCRCAGCDPARHLGQSARRLLLALHQKGLQASHADARVWLAVHALRWLGDQTTEVNGLRPQL